MATFQTRDRLSSLSESNHQPWLWVVHVFSLIFVLLTAAIRARIKRRYYGADDVALLCGHILYLVYWILLLLALISGLGKSEKVIDMDHLSKAARLVFGSRILLTIILCAVKLSSVFLIYSIFTKSVAPSHISKYTLLGLVLVQGFLGPLVISVGCSPNRAIYPKDSSKCSAPMTRWIVFIAFETALECAPFIRVLNQIIRLQVALATKIFVVLAFSSKLIVLIPAWIHVACYRHFLEVGRPSIGIVSTVITEELWASLALFSASIPILMRVAKKFDTSREVGVRTVQASRYNQFSRSKKFPPDSGLEMNSAKNNDDWQPDRNKNASYLNDDSYTAAVLSKRAGVGSINSTSESQGDRPLSRAT